VFISPAFESVTALEEAAQAYAFALPTQKTPLKTTT
jgi:hypothetical protein